MTSAPTLVERNAKFASTFDAGDLKIPPRLDLLIVSCVDARVDPAFYWGLELGDAFVIRNVGGRVTDEVIQHIRILHYLGTTLAENPTRLEVALVHHTGCGASRFTMPEVNEALTVALNTESATIDALAITDPRESIRTDIERLRAAEILPDDLLVSGYLYDVKTGAINEEVSTGSLRS